jgi:hypothetical protein
MWLLIMIPLKKKVEERSSSPHQSLEIIDITKEETVIIKEMPST